MKRRFWQIHLSTAVLLLLAAAGMVWQNLRLRYTAAWEELYRIQNAHPTYIGLVTLDALTEYGWPATAYSEGHRVFYTPKVHCLGLLADLAAMLTILAAVAVFSEWFIRHREGRKL